MRHEGRKCLVTGGGRGAGWGIAMALAQEGAEVAVADLDGEAAERVAAELSEAGGRGIAIACDVADERQVEAMFEEVARELGVLQLLVNTVAWIDPHSTVAEMPFENWQRAMRVNVDSVFLCSKHGIPLLREAGGGMIVNTSSIAGTRGFPYRAPYAASKAAIINLTETLAMELLGTGIRANCILPGVIAGERVRLLRESLAAKGLLPEIAADDVLNHAVVLDAMDVGRYVAFLASDEAAFVNGQALWLGDGPRMGAQAFFS